jgi:hypothetical protein
MLFLQLHIESDVPFLVGAQFLFHGHFHKIPQEILEIVDFYKCRRQCRCGRNLHHFHPCQHVKSLYLLFKVSNRILNPYDWNWCVYLLPLNSFKYIKSSEVNLYKYLVLISFPGVYLLWGLDKNIFIAKPMKINIKKHQNESQKFWFCIVLILSAVVQSLLLIMKF